MESNENTSIVTFTNISLCEVPDIIQEQFKGLRKLKKNISNAMDKAQTAKDSAVSAKNKSAGFLHRKDTIEAIQSATEDLAEAQVSAVQAQEVSFEYSQKLSEIVKYLFGLGITNIAMNRSVVRELELKLKGASEEELDELARQEIINVVKQLKAQQDMMVKQEELSKKVKSHAEALDATKVKDRKQDAAIERQAQIVESHGRLLDEKAKKDQAQDRELAKQAAIDAKHDRMIEAGERRDELQDAELRKQAAKDEEHDRLLAEMLKKNEEQDAFLAQQAELAKEREQKISELASFGSQHDAKISELQQSQLEQQQQVKDAVAVNDSQETKIHEIERRCEALEKQVILRSSLSFAVGAAAIVLAIIQFFL